MVIMVDVCFLTKVGVFSPSSRSVRRRSNHYLTITPKSLLCLYYKEKSGGVAKLLVSELIAEDYIVT